ncbi:MAG TPA: OsmC family protein [Flavipsychrobacter sp.]|nr:OsmC family protein [Flavipsychrobacter sp.]
MTSKVIYEGNLRTVATHLKSGNTIETDAPVDNKGKGERFSPTDLVATALASCMCTIMGIAANTHGMNIEGVVCEVEKIMTESPRKIGEIKVKVIFPQEKHYSEKEQKILEHAAVTCPVFLSLHPDCKKTVDFIWG